MARFILASWAGTSPAPTEVDYEDQQCQALASRHGRATLKGRATVVPYETGAPGTEKHPFTQIGGSAISWGETTAGRTDH